MKITVFTSNQPRHLSLINDLAKIADEVFAIMEVNTIFPGKNDDFFKKSEVMKKYFSYVIEAEKKVFGEVSFLPKNIRPLILKGGDLNDVSMKILSPALNSDEYIIFGSSYIKSQLIDYLVEKKALNIHMGVSPYYRGSSCNFWACYDGNLDMVGATIHLLSKGLDSGDMLFHALPSATENAFDLGMRAVKSAHIGLVENIRNGIIHNLTAIKQDKSKEIKYTKNNDFNDDVASEYLAKMPTKQQISEALKHIDLSKFLNPYVYHYSGKIR